MLFDIFIWLLIVVIFSILAYIISYGIYTIIGTIINNSWTGYENEVVNENNINYKRFLYKLNAVSGWKVIALRISKFPMPIAIKYKKLIKPCLFWGFTMGILYILVVYVWDIVSAFKIGDYIVFYTIGNMTKGFLQYIESVEVYKWITPIIILATIMFVTQRSRGYYDGQKERYKTAYKFVRKNDIYVQRLYRNTLDMVASSIDYYNHMYESSIDFMNEDQNFEENITNMKYINAYYNFYKFQKEAYKNISIIVENTYRKIILGGVAEEYAHILKLGTYSESSVFYALMNHVFEKMEHKFFTAQIVDFDAEMFISPDKIADYFQSLVYKNSQELNQELYYYKIEYVNNLKILGDSLVNWRLYVESGIRNKKEGIGKRIVSYLNK